MSRWLLRAPTVLLVGAVVAVFSVGCTPIANSSANCEGTHSHDRFSAFCAQNDHLVMDVKGEPIGEATMEMRESESLTWNSRTWTHDVSMHMTKATGRLRNGAVGVKVTASAGGTVPSQEQVGTLANGGRVTFTFRFTSPGNGIERHKVDLAITFTRPDATPAKAHKGLGHTVRCDSAPGMSNSSGCVYPDYTPTFQLSTQGNAGEVARHIREAQRAMPSHWGDPRYRHPLHRTTDGRLQDANRAARGNCPGTPTGNPSECDEYPFAATKEGASRNREWRAECVAWVSRSANRSAGGSQLQFFLKNRVLDGDAFWVQIVGP